MKQLTDAERLKIAVGLLGKRELDNYERICLEHEQDCERNGFYNVPAECENYECNECTINDKWRREHDCPYVED